MKNLLAYFFFTLHLISISSADSYSDWTLQHQIQFSSLTSDPDHDGLNNMLEFMLAGNPVQRDSEQLVTAVFGNQSTDLHFRRNKSAIATFSTAIQVSDDLNHWNSYPITETSVPEITIHISDENDVTQRVDVSIPSLSQRQYFRLAGYDHRNIDAQAASYQTLTGISSESALRISNFLVGLDQIGIRAHLLDAAIYRSDCNPGSQIAYSLFGHASAPLEGKASKWHHGLYFDGTQFFQFPLPVHQGERTIVFPISCSYWNTYSAATVFAADHSSLANRYVSFWNSGGANLNVSFYGGSGASSQAGSGGSTISAPLSFYLTRDRNLGSGVDQSISTERWAYSNRTSQTYLKGQAAYPLNRLTFGGSATKQYGLLVPGWFVFNQSLTDDQVGQFMNLLNQTVLPKWTMVWEGDSISGNIRDRAYNAEAWYGANANLVTVQTGGETSSNGVAQLGTPQGLNDSNLAGTEPVVVEIGFGANDLGNYTATLASVSTIHQNLRTMWTYAKTRGARVIARTVLPRGPGHVGDREADRLALNQLVRADEGIYYDALVDAALWAETNATVQPPFDDTALFSDKVHLQMGQNLGAEKLCRFASSAILKSGIIP